MNNLFTTRRLRRLGGFAALLALTPLTLTSTALAQDAKDVAKPADKTATTDVTTPTTWTAKYAKGDTHKLRENINVTGSFNGMDLNIVVTGIHKFEIKDATDTDYTVVETTQSEKTTVNDMDQPDKGMYATITRTITRAGLVKKAKVEDEQQGYPPELRTLQSMLANTPIPDKPVKSGDSWKTELDNKFVDGKKFTMTSTLVGMEKVAGMDALRVKVETTILPAADAKADDAIKVTGYYDVDPKTGQRVRNVYTVDNLAISAGGQSITLKFVYKGSLIVPGVNDKDDATDKKTDK